MKKQEIITPIFTDIQKVEKSQTEKNRENVEYRLFGKICNAEMMRTDLELYIDHYLGGDEDYKKLSVESLKEIVIDHYLGECIYKTIGIRPTEINIDDGAIKFKQQDYKYWYYLTFTRIPEDGEV